ncbi:MAG: hypothetical protein IJT96_09185 [Lachnospiraceae bacterium]|nr:hypothetical protein [Lachnospiraceae bacterium]
MNRAFDFSYNSYFELIKEIKDAGYHPVFFDEDLNEKERVFILRHDVDFSVEKAYEMAVQEDGNNIHSTFFFMVSSNQYNPLSRKNRDFIKKIHYMGHKIGLHFDETLYGEWKTASDFVRNVLSEVEILGDIIKGTDVVSMHEPSKKLLDADLRIERENNDREIINTYSKRFFRDFKYISDSRMEWHEDFSSILGEYDRLQILTHPIWWNKKPMSRKDILCDYIEKALTERSDYVKEYYPEVG